jgi:hypothetical protein
VTKINRHAGKTERVTLFVGFLIIFYQGLSGKPPMCAIVCLTASRSRTPSTTIFWRCAYRTPPTRWLSPFPLSHPPTPEFEDQTTRLIPEYKVKDELLSVHHRGEPDATGISLDTRISLDTHLPDCDRWVSGISRGHRFPLGCLKF